MEEEEQSTNK